MCESASPFSINVTKIIFEKQNIEGGKTAHIGIVLKFLQFLKENSFAKNNFSNKILIFLGVGGSFREVFKEMNENGRILGLFLKAAVSR